MKPTSFAVLAQHLIDLWISTQEIRDVSILSGAIANRLAANMVVANISFAKSNDGQFSISLVHDYQLPSTFDEISGALRTRLPMLPEGHLHRSILKAITVRRPTLFSEVIDHDNLRTSFDILALPRKTSHPGGDWCFVLGVVNYIIKAVALRELDDVDLAVLQLLREGLQIR